MSMGVRKNESSLSLSISHTHRHTHTHQATLFLHPTSAGRRNPMVFLMIPRRIKITEQGIFIHWAYQKHVGCEKRQYEGSFLGIF